MRVIVVFSDHERYIPRPREGDICLIAREEKRKIQIKIQCRCTGFNEDNIPILEIIPSSNTYIDEAKKINVEIIGHSSKGGKSIQSDVTEQFPLQNIALDDLVMWLEHDLLKNNTSRSTIAMLSCEAADGKNEYPSVAVQMFALFQTKPEKLTARMGYGYIEKHIYSLRTFAMVVKTAVDHQNNNKEDKDIAEQIIFPILRTYNSFFPYSTETPLGEKFVYFLGNNGLSYRLDKQLYDLFQLIKRLQPDDSQIQTILKKDPINIQADEFVILAKFGIETNIERLSAKSKLVLAGSINEAMQFNVNLTDYQLKQTWIHLLNSLQQTVQENDKMINKEELINFIDKTIDFIRYRHPRNYQIDKLNVLIDTLTKIEANNGIITEEFNTSLVTFKNYIASSNGIYADAIYRGNAVGVRLPSYYQAIKKATETKNSEFARSITNFLDKGYSAPLDKATNPDSTDVDLTINFLIF